MACARLGWTSQQLGTHWDTLKMGQPVARSKSRVLAAALGLTLAGVGKVKFGGGFYCGKLQDIFARGLSILLAKCRRGLCQVINGFYMAMRGQYLIPGRPQLAFCAPWLCMPRAGSSVWWFKVKWQASDMSWKASAAQLGQDPRRPRKCVKTEVSPGGGGQHGSRSC